MHVEAWAEMTAKNDPPIVNSPLTPYLDAHEFQKVRLQLPLWPFFTLSD